MAKDIIHKKTSQDHERHSDHQSQVAKSRYELICKLENGMVIHDFGSFSYILRTFLETTYEFGFEEAAFRRIDLTKGARQ